MLAEQLASQPTGFGEDFTHPRQAPPWSDRPYLARTDGHQHREKQVPATSVPVIIAPKPEAEDAPAAA